MTDYIPGLQKYDMCMTEQVPGPQGVKIVGRHIASAPNRQTEYTREGAWSLVYKLIINIFACRNDPGPCLIVDDIFLVHAESCWLHVVPATLQQIGNF